MMVDGDLIHFAVRADGNHYLMDAHIEGENASDRCIWGGSELIDQTLEHIPVEQITPFGMGMRMLVLFNAFTRAYSKYGTSTDPDDDDDYGTDLVPAR